MSFGVFANVPEGIPRGKITAFVTSFEAGGSDSGLVPDDTPDSIPLDGTITITPRVGTMNWPGLPKPQKSVMSAMVCPVFEGDLYRPGTTAETYGDVEPGVWVIATEQPDAQPDKVQYEVRWNLARARVQPPSTIIDVPAGGTVDLATVIPASPEPGTVIVVSTVERERAEAAADLAEGFAGDAETARDQAVTAKDLAEGFTGRAETAADAADAHADAARGSASAAHESQVLAVDAKRDAVSAAEAAGVAASDAALARGAAVAARGDAELFAGHAEASAEAAADSADLAEEARDQAEAAAASVEAGRVVATLGGAAGTLLLTFPALAAGPYDHTVRVPIGA